MKEWIENVANSFKDFIVDHSDNAILWICLFFGGILVFWFTYNALNKNK